MCSRRSGRECSRLSGREYDGERYHEVECTPVVLVYVRPYHHLNWCDSADLPEFKEIDKHDNAKTLKNNA